MPRTDLVRDNGDAVRWVVGVVVDPHVGAEDVAQARPLQNISIERCMRAVGGAARTVSPQRCRTQDKGESCGTQRLTLNHAALLMIRTTCWYFDWTSPLAAIACTVLVTLAIISAAQMSGASHQRTELTCVAMTYLCHHRQIVRHRCRGRVDAYG